MITARWTWLLVELLIEELLAKALPTVKQRLLAVFGISVTRTRTIT
jgi:hypothetical protein